jgi:four helix bundle protein
MSEIGSQPEGPRGPIRSFTDLIVWQKARTLGQRVFELSKAWPTVERYALIDQMRRSSRSVGANIAEAWGKRRYEASFVAKLVDSDAEAHETEHWLIVAHDHEYLRSDDLDQLRDLLSEMGRMLGSMINKPKAFVSHQSDV